MSNGNGANVFWKIAGPLAFLLLVSVASVVYGQLEKRVTRIEDLLDRIVPTIYRIEEQTRNTEALIREHARED